MKRKQKYKVNVWKVEQATMYVEATNREEARKKAIVLSSLSRRSFHHLNYQVTGIECRGVADKNGTV